MRVGPSTGIPSKTEQSDVNIAVYGAHGDAPRVVLAPLSVSDCLMTTEWAVYLAEAWQTPVVVLSDQSLGQAHAVIDPEASRPPPHSRRVNGAAKSVPFKRYAITEDPVTAMPPPGDPGHQWVAEGLTHGEVGLPASDAAMHLAQIEKRARKLAQLDPGGMWGESWGDGDTAIVTFGSGFGPAREAARRLTASGHPTRAIGLRLLSPIPHIPIERALAGARRVVVVEQNHGAQLYRHLAGNRAIPVTAESMARPGPLPFRPGEIVAYVSTDGAPS
jgi:2-oxoglutarate ferredoxin oxidoreductase subunit alpha